MLYRLFSKKNKSGEDYIYTQVIQISINNFAFEGKDEVFNIHCDQDSQGEIYNDKLIFIEIYIPNLKKKWYNKEELSEVERYLLALVETDIPTSLELGKGDEIMNEYINESIEVTDDESFGGSYDKELAWREQVIIDAKEDGLKEGLEQGIEQGIEQGKMEGQKEIIKYMSLQYDVESIVKITGLSKEEVEKYLKENS